MTPNYWNIAALGFVIKVPTNIISKVEDYYESIISEKESAYESTINNYESTINKL